MYKYNYYFFFSPFLFSLFLSSVNVRVKSTCLSFEKDVKINILTFILVNRIIVCGFRVIKKYSNSYEMRTRMVVVVVIMMVSVVVCWG